RRAGQRGDDLILEVGEKARELGFDDAPVTHAGAELVSEAALGIELLRLARGADRARDARRRETDVETGEAVDLGCSGGHPDAGYERGRIAVALARDVVRGIVRQRLA